MDVDEGAFRIRLRMQGLEWSEWCTVRLPVPSLPAGVSKMPAFERGLSLLDTSGEPVHLVLRCSRNPAHRHQLNHGKGRALYDIVVFADYLLVNRTPWKVGFLLAALLTKRNYKIDVWLDAVCLCGDNEQTTSSLSWSAWGARS